MEYAADNQRAFAVFQQARESFILGRFAEARIELLAYRRLVDYSRFTQTDNRKAIQPICSIILVIYNADKHAFLECLQSCLAQKDSTFEVIVVDNGGNQALSADLETYPVLHVINPGNLLPSEGRNVGAYFARGEYLVFVDDDGILASDYLYQVEQALQDKNTLGIRGRILPKSPQGQTNIHYDLGSQVKSSIFDLEGNMAIKRLIFERVAGFDPLMFGHEGGEMTERCLEFHPGMQVLYWPKMLLYHDYAEGHRLQEKRERQRVGSNYRNYLRKLSDLKSNNNINKRQMMSQAGVSIILRAGNNRQAAKTFIQQLVKINTYQPVELVVFFNDPKVEHISLVRELAGQLKILVLPAAGRTFASLNSKVRYDQILAITTPAEFTQDNLAKVAKELRSSQNEKLQLQVPGLSSAFLFNAKLLEQLSNIAVTANNNQVQAAIAGTKPVAKSAPADKNPKTVQTQKVTPAPAQAKTVEKKSFDSSLDIQIATIEAELQKSDQQLSELYQAIEKLDVQYDNLPPESEEAQALRAQLQDLVWQSNNKLIELNSMHDELEGLRTWRYSLCA